MIMLAMSERDRPCRARISPSSFGRVTVSTPSDCDTSIGAATVCWSVPFGPVTVTSRPSIVTVTPLGTVTGIRPILDIEPLPHRRSATPPPPPPLLPALFVRHEAARGRDDRDPQAAQHSRQAVLL